MSQHLRDFIIHLNLLKSNTFFYGIMSVSNVINDQSWLHMLRKTTIRTIKAIFNQKICSHNGRNLHT